jgi:FMN-dependent NADH-azoreductase
MKKLSFFLKKTTKKIFSSKQKKIKLSKKSKNDILIISSYSDMRLSLTHKLLEPILKTFKKKYKFNYKIINLYSYNIPFYKLNKKIPKSFISLTNILDEYSNYIFIFPVWYSAPPAVLKNFIDWSGTWGTEKNINGKIVGTLEGKKASIIASCWDKRKTYIEKLLISFEYQFIESVFSFYKIKHIQTLIIQDAHNRKQKNINFIKKNLELLIKSINESNDC